MKDTERSLSLGATPREKGPGHQASAPGARGAGWRDPGDHAKLGDIREGGHTGEPAPFPQRAARGDAFSSVRTRVGFLSFIPTPKDYKLPEFVPLES